MTAHTVLLNSNNYVCYKLWNNIFTSIYLIEMRLMFMRQLINQISVPFLCVPFIFGRTISTLVGGIFVSPGNSGLPFSVTASQLFLFKDGLFLL
jgi:hypothetical protein